jgi:hypothetical protein
MYSSTAIIVVGSAADIEVLGKAYRAGPWAISPWENPAATQN